MGDKKVVDFTERLRRKAGGTLPAPPVSSEDSTSPPPVSTRLLERRTTVDDTMDARILSILRSPEKNAKDEFWTLQDAAPGYRRLGLNSALTESEIASLTRVFRKLGMLGESDDIPRGVAPALADGGRNVFFHVDPGTQQIKSLYVKSGNKKGIEAGDDKRGIKADDDKRGIKAGDEDKDNIFGAKLLPALADPVAVIPAKGWQMRRDEKDYRRIFDAPLFQSPSTPEKPNPTVFGKIVLDALVKLGLTKKDVVLPHVHATSSTENDSTLKLTSAGYDKMNAGLASLNQGVSV